MFKHGIPDGVSRSVMSALPNLGVTGINSVRSGRVIEMELNETDKAKALEIAKDMADKILAQKDTEEYTIHIVEDKHEESIS